MTERLEDAQLDISRSQKQAIQNFFNTGCIIDSLDKYECKLCVGTIVHEMETSIGESSDIRSYSAFLILFSGHNTSIIPINKDKSTYNLRYSKCVSCKQKCHCYVIHSVEGSLLTKTQSISDTICSDCYTEIVKWGKQKYNETDLSEITSTLI